MSESRIQNAFSRTTILTVGRLLLFVVAGFAIGLVLGVVTEEPQLLAGHVRGDTSTVELDGALAERAEAEAAAALAGSGSGRDAASVGDVGAVEEAGEGADFASDSALEDGRGLPDVAAAPAGWGAGNPAAGGGLDSEEARGAAPGSAASPTEAGVGGWAIQVGAFGDEPSAQALASRLEGKGYPIAVLPAGPESNRWRVRVQPLGEEQAARGTAVRIEREERLPTWVIRLEGQPRG